MLSFSTVINVFVQNTVYLLLKISFVLLCYITVMADWCIFHETGNIFFVLFILLFQIAYTKHCLYFLIHLAPNVLDMCDKWLSKYLK